MTAAATVLPAGEDAPAYRPRSYQVEMFEASLKENIIVTVCHVYSSRKVQANNILQMGTGSGKTHMYVRFSTVELYLKLTVSLQRFAANHEGAGE